MYVGGASRGGQGEAAQTGADRRDPLVGGAGNPGEKADLLR